MSLVLIITLFFFHPQYTDPGAAEALASSGGVCPDGYDGLCSGKLDPRAHDPSQGEVANDGQTGLWRPWESSLPTNPTIYYKHNNFNFHNNYNNYINIYSLYNYNHINYNNLKHYNRERKWSELLGPKHSINSASEDVWETDDDTANSTGTLFWSGWGITSVSQNKGGLLCTVEPFLCLEQNFALQRIAWTGPSAS